MRARLRPSTAQALHVVLMEASLFVNGCVVLMRMVQDL